MISDELILHLFRHAQQRVVVAFELGIGAEGRVEYRLDLRLHLLVVGLGQARILVIDRIELLLERLYTHERITLQRATATDARRVDVLALRVKIRQLAKMTLTKIRRRLLISRLNWTMTSLTIISQLDTLKPLWYSSMSGSNSSLKRVYASASGA